MCDAAQPVSVGATRWEPTPEDSSRLPPDFLSMTTHDFDDLLSLPEPAPAGPRPGDLVHFLVHTNIVTAHGPLIVKPGTTVTLTGSIIELSKDRNGQSWLDLVDDPAAQLRQHGRVRIARGPAPTDLLPSPGSTEHDDMHLLAHDAAWRISDPQARAEALAQVHERFGTLGRSRTLRRQDQVR